MTQGNRLERRKARTRAALVTAAQGFIADGRVNAPVLEITQAADVGMGSFYNHFESKEDLFSAAIDSALESVGAYLDTLTEGLEDPVEVFTQSFRLAGRLFRLEPDLSRVLLNSAMSPITSDLGLAPRSRRDILAASQQGRFDVEDVELALALVAGSLLALGRLLLDDPDRDSEAAVDRMATDVLRALGVPLSEAHELCHRPLPPSYDSALRSVIERAIPPSDPA
ncbi:MAG: TetR family transcriptional regulator [Gordonia sp. (in: high G+C Gram-positive bacteria)]|nr:MAG: TetR family transcriptional regulator [Gordonia sp. (in: high G+C Gram-positive bacteria)]